MNVYRIYLEFYFLSAWDLGFTIYILAQPLSASSYLINNCKKMNFFAFKNISYSVPTKDRNVQKQILSQIGGVVRAGETMGILGPSGAGKTSLLNVLTLNAMAGISTGSCVINGHNVTSKIFREHCCVVPQEEHHRPSLTARQTLTFAANLYIKGTPEEKEAEVNKLLSKLGLMMCADTIVGNQFMPGLSGGQKKRLSVALALLKKPSVMLLDEPTSGLDAAASYHVMGFVRTVAKEFGICVICTIHQPSSPIYMDFTTVMLLSQGRMAYFGTPNGSIKYFSTLGYEVKQFSNPAEYLLDVVNAEFTEPAKVVQILDKWESTGGRFSDHDNTTENIVLRLPITTANQTVGFYDQVKFITQRQLRIILTDPMIYMGRAVMFLILCSFFAVIYVKGRDRNQEQVLNRLWFCMWLLGVPTSLGVIGVYAFNEEYRGVKKEVKNGMYDISAFLLSCFVLQFPVMFILAVFAVGIPGFAILDMWAPHFFEITAVYMCILFTYECIARCMSVAFDNPLLGMLNFLQVWFISFLFAGVMIPEDMVIWPFRIFCSIMPLKWGISSIAWLDAYDAEYNGAYLCESADRNDCLFHYEDGVATEPGWSCSKNQGGVYNPLQCYGRTGDQVLQSLGMNYDVVSAEDNIARNFAIIIGIALGFQLIYTVITIVKCNAVSNITSDDSSTHSAKQGAIEMKSLNSN